MSRKILAFHTALLWFVVAYLAAVSVATQDEARLCFLVRPDESSVVSFAAAHAAVDDYASLYSGYRWRLIAAGSHGNDHVADMVRWLAVNGAASCDVLLGPGFSSLAIAASPLVEMPWVDFSSTSVALSDKVAHLSYSRVMPSDALLGAGFASFVRSSGWSVVNTVCTNEPYGRSITQQFADAFVSANSRDPSARRIEVSSCLELGATDDDVDELLQFIGQSSSRIVVVGVIEESTATRALLRRIVQNRWHERLVLIFTETMCSGTPHLRTIPGAICVTFGVDSTATRAFETGPYSRRSQSAISSELQRMEHPLQYPDGVASSGETVGVYAAYSHDAALHVMSALNSTVLQLSNGTAVLDAIRTHTTRPVGRAVPLSTDITLSSTTGDRLTGLFAIKNINASGAERTAGVITGASGRVLGVWVETEAQYTAGRPSILWFGRYESTDPPADVDEYSEFELTVELMAMIAAGALLLAAVVLAVCVCCSVQGGLSRIVDTDAPSEAAAGMMGSSVIVLKVATAAALIIDGAPIGYLISYLAVTLLGVVSGLIDVVTRFWYVLTVVSSEEMLSFGEEQAVKQRLRAASVFTTILSNMPTVIICGAMLSGGSAGDRQTLLLVLAMFAAFSCGVKLRLVPSFVRNMMTDGEHEGNAGQDVRASGSTAPTADEAQPVPEGLPASSSSSAAFAVRLKHVIRNLHVQVIDARVSSRTLTTSVLPLLLRNIGIDRHVVEQSCDRTTSPPVARPIVDGRGVGPSVETPTPPPEE